MSRHTLPALLVASALALAGCGGGSGSSSPSGSAAGGSTSPAAGTSSGAGAGSPQPASVVQGVRLTAQGSSLRLGRTAKVSWKPDQRTLGVIAVSVTRLQKVPMSAFSAWRLDPATRRSTAYFVHATVRNLGHSDLSGKPVPLYLLDQRNTLLEPSTFQAQYAPCPSRPLPRHFSHGRRTSACLVYFVPRHGRLVAISFRPTEQFRAITWKGRVASGARRH